MTKDEAREAAWKKLNINGWRLMINGTTRQRQATEACDEMFNAGYDFAKSESNDLREKAQALVDQVGYDQRKWVKEFSYSYQRELAALKEALK